MGRGDRVEELSRQEVRTKEELSLFLTKNQGEVAQSRAVALAFLSRGPTVGTSDLWRWKSLS